MKFILEPDGADEPTIWAIEGGDTDQYQYTHLLSRVDLAPDTRRFWPDVVARMTATTNCADACTCDHDSWHEASCKCCNRRWGLAAPND